MKKYIALIVVLVTILTSACSPNNTGDKTKVDIRVALATEKYSQDEDISSLSEGTLYVAAAKGETEGAQFIVKTDKDISDYSCWISDLKSSDDTIEASAVNIQTEIYAKCSENEYSDLPAGYYPDALIPTQLIVEAGENEIKANKNQAFLVDINVPQDAKAGIYTGKITIDLQGQQRDIPVELEVFDFAISDVPYTLTCYLIWQQWLHYGELDSTDEKYMDYYDKLLEYNICGYTFPHTTAEEFVSYVREYYNKIPCYGIPYDSISNTQNDWAKYSAYMSELAKACVEDNFNYFDKAYYYFDMFYDEYNHPGLEWRKEAMIAIFEQCDTLEQALVDELLAEGKIESKDCELAQSIVNLQHVIPSSGYDADLAEYDVNHCSGPNATRSTKQNEDYVATLTEEENFWWYHAITSIQYPYPNKIIDGYSVSARDHFWSNYESGIVGDLFWNATGFCNWWAFDTSNQYKPLADLYTTGSHDNVSNGDGYLMYPGLPYGSDEPFGSLRLVQVRDGIDDNTYMGILGDKYQELSSKYQSNTESAKSFVAFLNKQIISRWVSKLNSQKLADARTNLAKAIELADKQGVIFHELSVEENEIKYVIYTDASTALNVNGTAIEHKVASEGRCYSGTVAIDKTAELTLDFLKNGETETMKLWTVSTGEMIKDFETTDDLTDCIVYSDYGSSVTQNTNVAYAKTGSSLKAVLSGHDFGSTETNEQYYPKLGFEVASTDKKVSEIESIEFWVYNPSSKDIVIETYLEGNSDTLGKLNFKYDTITLKAGQWRKIIIDNFSYVSRDSETLDVYTEFGLRTTNSVGDACELYIDNVFVR